MPWPVHPNGLLGAQGDNDTYRIERSLRFNSADSAYLSRTPASAGNRKTWTWSGWVKRSALSSFQYFFGAGTGSNDATFAFYADDTFACFLNDGTGATGLRTSSVYRDTSSWYHIVVSLDTTQSTSTNRQKIYINGSEVTAFGTASYPNQNTDWPINNTNAHDIGRARGGSYFNGYITEINFIDGQALTPSSFGETDPITGRWKAKAYSGAYGTNGFYLKFADNSGTTATTLGKDSSGNGNNWTPNNFSVTAGAGNDSLVDSPTNYGTDSGVGGEVRGNYCTFNSAASKYAASDIAINLSDGNLRASGSSGAGTSNASGTFAVKTGKWYYEATVVTGGNQTNIGYSEPNTYSNLISIKADGTTSNITITSGSAFTYTTNDILGIALNLDNGTVTAFKNGVQQFIGNHSLSGTITSPWCQFSTSQNASLYFNFGQRPFAYTAPSGFKALCTTNLPTPTIKKPSKYFDVVTRTSDGASNYTKTGLEFSPDLIWTKDRTSAYDHVLWDTVRGATKYLNSNTTSAELIASQLASFNSDGYTINYGMGQANFSTDRYVDWIWDEAPIAGMDIVSYTGDGNNNRSVPHNLGVVPSMVIIKSRNYGTTGWDWVVYHKSLNTSTEYLLLNSTAAKASASGLWAHTSSNLVFPTAYSSTNSAGVTSPYATFIAYLFAEVEGFSKFGSYTGNGSADGPFVWCGFRPRWVLWKSSTETSFWNVIDTSRTSANVVGEYLSPNTNSAEANTTLIDALSSGFKLRTSSAGNNASSQTYIFAAFAESPFKYARAR